MTELEKIFRLVVMELMEDITHADDLLNDTKKVKLFESVMRRLEELRIGVKDLIPHYIAENYVKGYKITGRELGSVAGNNAVKNMLGNRMHIEAIDRISNDTYQDLASAIRTAEINGIRSIDRILREVKESVGTGVIKGDTREAITKLVLKDFSDNGLTAFITKDNKKLPLDFYAMTVTRTKLTTANTEGAVNRFVENDIDLVVTPEIGSTCEICAPREGIVVSLSGKNPYYPHIDEIGGLPPWHPNCEHDGIRPFMEEFKTQKEIDDARQKGKDFDPDKDDRDSRERKAYEKEQEIRREANQEKKDYYEMRSVLGDKAPDSLGEYRRLSRADNDKWNRLQDDYRSELRDIRKELDGEDD